MTITLNIKQVPALTCIWTSSLCTLFALMYCGDESKRSFKHSFMVAIYQLPVLQCFLHWTGTGLLFGFPLQFSFISSYIFTSNLPATFPSVVIHKVSKLPQTPRFLKVSITFTHLSNSWLAMPVVQFRWTGPNPSEEEERNTKALLESHLNDKFPGPKPMFVHIR